MFEDHSVQQDGSDFVKYTKLQNKLAFAHLENQQLQKEAHFQQKYTEITEAQIKEVMSQMTEENEKASGVQEKIRQQKEKFRKLKQ